ncbi:MAG: YceI family protein [Leucobacter sp.]
MTLTADQIPGYIAGSWEIDHAHSEVGFSIRHLAISKVKGKFEAFDAQFVTGENPLDSRVNATAEVASVSTGEKNRDGHLRTGDFFEAEEFPQLTFVSTGARDVNGELKVDGNLTMRGVTKPVTFDFELGGFGEDTSGTPRVGFTATAVVKREDFGLTWNAPLEKGGFMLGNDVTITIDAQAMLQA